MHPLQASLPLFVICCALLGLFIGSFLNVVIYRLPIMIDRDEEMYFAQKKGLPLPEYEPFNLNLPRSRCPVCGHQIAAWENIPVLSYLILRGRCSACKTPISKRYPAIEILTGVLSGLLAAALGPTWFALASLLLLYSLIALTFIDIDTYLLPDAITLPLVWAGILVSLMGYGRIALDQAVIGAVAGYMSLWTVAFLFRLVMAKEGMGAGDFKLLAVLGAWLGWKMLPMVIVMSSVSGAVLGIGMIMAKRKGWGWGKELPFGPYLTIAGFITLLYGQRLLNGYLSFFSM